MFSKLFKKTKKEVTKSNIEKISNKELKTVIGGTDTEPVILTTGKILTAPAKSAD